VEEEKEQAELRKDVTPTVLLELRPRFAKTNEIFGRVIAPHRQLQEPNQQKLFDQLVADNQRMKIMLADAFKQGWKPGKSEIEVELEAMRDAAKATSTPADSTASDSSAQKPATT